MNTSADWLLLASSNHFVEGNAVDLNDLVTDTGNISVRTTHASTDTFDHDFVVLVDEVDRAVAGSEGSELVAVLDQGDLDGLADAAVGLLGFDADLLDDDALGLSRPTEWVVTLARLQHALLVSAVRPAKLLAVLGHLGPSKESPTHIITSSKHVAHRRPLYQSRDGVFSPTFVRDVEALPT